MFEQQEIDRLSGAGLRTFRNIARQWSLDCEEETRLLGPEGCQILDDLEESGAAVPSAEALHRISLVFSIYAALESLLPQRSAKWIRSRNRAPLFGGRPALDLMLSNDIDDLRRVRAYLEAQFN